MKILFVLHSPRKIDGVGDYTTILAKKLQDWGHETAILGFAMNGEKSLHGSRRELNGVPYFHIPAPPFSKTGEETAGKILQEYSPAWISLQFVNYAWNHYGVVFSIIPSFRRLFAGRALHVYFHEIWIGFYPNSPPKRRLIGFVQKVAITILTRAIRPKLVHTNSSFYEKELSRIHLRVQRNPLFGNIPFECAPDFSWIYLNLQTLSIPITPANRPTFFIIGLFGNLSEALLNKNLYSTILKEASARQQKPLFLLIGILRPDGQRILNLLREQFPQISFLDLGSHSPKKISGFLQFVDCSCATAPLHQIEKSGTFAALVEHQVPTIVLPAPESAGFCPELPPNSRLFHPEDTSLQLPDNNLAKPAGLVERHANFFFDTLTSIRVYSRP